MGSVATQSPGAQAALVELLRNAGVPGTATITPAPLLPNSGFAVADTVAAALAATGVAAAQIHGAPPVPLRSHPPRFVD